MTLIDDFRKELKDILPGTIKEFRPDGYFKQLTLGDRVLSFANDVARPYLRALRILRTKSENSRKYLSDEKLTKMLDEFIVDLKYDDEIKAMREIDGRITKLFDSIRTMKTETQLFIIPIMRLSVSQDITIGDTTITALNEQTLESLETRYSTKLRYPQLTLSEAVENLRKRNNTPTFAIVTVDAPDDDKALEMAVQKTDTCLNVLRLYYSEAPFYLRDEFVEEFGVSMTHLNVSTKSLGESHRRVNLIVNIPAIDVSAISTMRKAGLDTINRLLLKREDEITQLQGNILDAIFWFGNAVKERQRISKFVKYVIALETLLIPTGEQNKKHTISKRLTTLLYSKADKDQQKEVFRTMYALYDRRNSIMHSGENSVNEADLRQVGYWAGATIQYLLRYAEKYNTIVDLFNKELPIDEVFFSTL